MSNERKRDLKEWAIDEARRYAVIVAYLWVLFVIFELHKLIILRQHNIGYELGYKIGFAVVNALVTGKVILVAETLRTVDRFKEKPLIYPILFKSAIFSAIVVCFEFVEEVVVGLFHGKSIAQSIPDIGGGGVQGILMVGVIMFVVLTPFIAVGELDRVSQGEVTSLVFKRRTNSDVVGKQTRTPPGRVA